VHKFFARVKHIFFLTPYKSRFLFVSNRINNQLFLILFKAFFDGRKSAESERKRSAALNVSHKERQSKRQLLECTSAVKREDTDTTDASDTASDDEDSVQTSTGTAV
jgi:hypothetical protein